MKKIFLIFLCIFMGAAKPCDVSAADKNMKISEYEAEILKAGTTDVSYKKGMVIGSELVDIPAGAAIEAAESFEGYELNRVCETNILINLKGAYKKTELMLSPTLKDYEGLIDNIIINADGLYIYIKPEELNLKKTDSEDTGLSVNDEENVVARYNGGARGRFIKLVLMAVFGVLAVYIAVFVFALRKIKLKAGVGKKAFYIASGILFVTSLILLGIVFISDFSEGAKKSPLSLKEDACIDIDITGASQGIRGLYIGLPIYSDSFNPSFTAAFRRSDDPAKGDMVLGGVYSEKMDIIKFPVGETGVYYLRNNNVTFSDVNESDAGLYEAVSVLAAKNILSGKSDDVFGTEDTVTRAETVTMLCKMLNIENEGGEEDFSDISSGDWFYSYAMGAKESGVLSGYDDNTFRAQNTITRQEFAALMGQIMVNRLGYILPEGEEEISDFADGGDIALWARPYICLLERESLGIWQEEYAPRAAISRGEAAMLLYRVYCLYS